MSREILTGPAAGAEYLPVCTASLVAAHWLRDINIYDNMCCSDDYSVNK
jgi:hypothetical protein